MRTSTLIVALPLALFACSQAPERASPPPRPVASAAPSAAATGEPSTDGVSPRLLRRFQPLPESYESPANVRTREKIDLGRMLFFDPRLSRDGTIACESCHRLAAYGVDHERTSTGVHGERGTRNSPTVWNAAGFFAQFWDGRAATVEKQASEPILGGAEMGMSDAAHVETTLRGIGGYELPFRAAFPTDAEPRTLANVSLAIAAFERGLSTPGRWDAYLRGDRAALSGPEKDGLRGFLNAGCMVCHTGPLLGGSMFERAGVVEPWPNQADQGRGRVTHLKVDAMMFKVPTLRNVAMTAPYFHDGSAATLEEAVRTMGTYQLGLDLTPEEVASICTWLRALTGDLPSPYVAKPSLPLER